MGHDQLFKDVLRTFFYEFLQVFLPEVAEAIDPDAITFLDPQTFTDIPEGQLRIADLVANLHALVGTPELVLVHTEVQSDEEHEIGYRIWEYNALLTIRHRRPVISIGFLPFAVRGGVTFAHYSCMALGQETAGVNYWRIAVRGLSAEDYLALPSLLGVALAALMRPPGDDKVELKVAILQRLAASGLDEARLFLLVNFVESYLPLEGMEAATYQTRLQEEENTTVQTLELTWADRLRQEGLEQGVAQGVVQGTLQAKQEMLLDLTRTRFGAVPADLAERVATADDRLLTRMLRQVVQAQRPEEISG